MSLCMKAYRVSVPEMIVIASDEREAREWIESGNVRVQRLTVEELRGGGGTYPVGSYDPDREMTCAEVADAMAAEGREQ